MAIGAAVATGLGTYTIIRSLRHHESSRVMRCLDLSGALLEYTGAAALYALKKNEKRKVGPKESRRCENAVE